MDFKIVWPLLRNEIRGNLVNNTFGNVRKYENGLSKPHQGWDLKAAVGTPVYAIADGKIAFVRSTGAYGLQLCQEFTFEGTLLYAFYAHLHSVYANKDQIEVHVGQIIAATGKSGNASNLPSSEDHLHVEIRTKMNPGLGLEFRISPLHVFGKCPLHTVITGGAK